MDRSPTLARWPLALLVATFVGLAAAAACRKSPGPAERVLAEAGTPTEGDIQRATRNVRRVGR